MITEIAHFRLFIDSLYFQVNYKMLSNNNIFQSMLYSIYKVQNHICFYWSGLNS